MWLLSPWLRRCWVLVDDPSTETFTVYSERLDQFFVPNNIGSYPASASEEVIAAAEKKKVAVMISVIDKKTYSVLRDLYSPVNPKDKTFEQLSEFNTTAAF